MPANNIIDNATIEELAEAAVDMPARIATLEATIVQLNTEIEDGRKVREHLRHDLAVAEKREKETRAQFNDLKERLVNAEATNQRMRGYISRVQEDDVVREELVAVGDPDGEQRLVPKRRGTAFHEPAWVSDLDACKRGIDELQGYRSSDARERRKPRHWVTY
jgi:chromosome segregation ATPase